jgi:hypothetical protein
MTQMAGKLRALVAQMTAARNAQERQEMPPPAGVGSPPVAPVAPAQISPEAQHTQRAPSSQGLPQMAAGLKYWVAGMAAARQAQEQNVNAQTTKTKTINSHKNITGRMGLVK